ncbi:MAG: hypothetical protein HPZ91_17850 [Lentisphaeria bacterium]|nr:hypothetical protein [Lentisphaeria bacterium]
MPILAGALLLLLLEAALLPRVPVWITDNGNKYMILRNLAEQGTPAMANPAAQLDSGNRFFPDGGFHFQRHGLSIFSVYPEFFSVLALPGYLLLGDTGLPLIPIAGTMAALALFLALLSPLRLSVRLETLLSALLLCGTPLLFYSGTFWEMTVSAVFPLAALLAARKRQMLFAGMLLGMGLWLREEFYLIALASGTAALIFYPKQWRRYIPFGLGFLLWAVPLWLYNSHGYGHILGLHGALYYTHNADAVPTLAGRIAGTFEGYFIYLFKFNSGNPETVWYYWPLLLPMLLLPVAGAFRSFRFKREAAVAALLSWAVLLWLFCENPEPATASGLTVGFITASPLLAGFFLMWRNLLTRGPRPLRMITLAALLYCAVLPAILTRSDIGLIWGPRHYLPVYPVLFALSFIGFARLGWLSQSRRIFLPAFLVIALLLQLIGMRMLFSVAEDAARAELTIAAQEPEVVVSDVFFLPEMTPRLFFEKKWMFVKNDAELDALLKTMREKGVKKFTLVLSPRFRRLNDSAIAALLERAPLIAEPHRFKAPGSGFLELLIGECSLQ